MKKSVLVISVSTLLILIFSGCQKNKSVSAAKIQNATYVEAPSLPTQAELQKIAENDKADGKIDVDLTTMSATMIYSYVFDMLMDADSYKDKTIKVKGLFKTFANENSSDPYFSIIIPDATACCQQGIEFIWVGNHNYPEDYPEQDQEITITGKYKIFMTKDELQYTYLQVSSLEF